MYRYYTDVFIRVRRERPITTLPSSTFSTRLSDGAPQGGRCGSCIVMKINARHHFKLRLNCLEGTNKKLELLALWYLLKFVVDIGIDTLRIFVDSMEVINWANHIGSLYILSLYH